ncbi:MAG: MATE family efflux transporter [Arcicella sp.]|nr:MATE family efflux transporter [Arcicella sp.]
MKKLLGLLMQAFRGEGLNYTEMNINRAIFLLAVPMVIEMSFEALFALVDAFFVARVGVDAVAVVGITESVMALIYAVAWGLSTATTALVARRVGEGNTEQAGESTAQGIFISLTLGVIFGLIGFTFSKEILQFMGASTSVINAGINYTKLLFLSSPSIIMLFTLSGALRGAGDASKAMWSLALANIINMVLDAYLIWHLQIGVVGAAIATTIGRTVGVLLQLYLLSRKNGNVQLASKHFRYNLEVILSLLKLGAGNTGQFMIPSISWTAVVMILAAFGDNAVAGYTIAIRVIIFTILPAWGLGNAAAALVGQHLGAGNPEKAESSAWRTAFLNMTFLTLVGVVFYFLSPQIIGAFGNSNPEVLAVGVACLRVICFGYIFFGIGMVLTQALNGAGDTITPTYINIVSFFLVQIPLAYALANTFHLGSKGVFIAIVAGDTVMTILSIMVFRRGKWKSVKV